MHKCTECGAEWETNYCPMCARTIDRTAVGSVQKIPPSEVVRQPKSIPTKSPLVQPVSAEPCSDVREQIDEAYGKLTGKLFLGIILAVVGIVVTMASLRPMGSALDN